MPQRSGPDGDMTRIKEPAAAAEHAAARRTAAYIRMDGDSYVVSSRPPAPPYVAAAPGDDPALILERIRRLAAP